jgi:hypothetical protein
MNVGGPQQIYRVDLIPYPIQCTVNPNIYSTSQRIQLRSIVFIYLLGRSGTKSTSIATITWPIVPALHYMVMNVEQLAGCVIDR